MAPAGSQWGERAHQALARAEPAGRSPDHERAEVDVEQPSCRRPEAGLNLSPQGPSCSGSTGRSLVHLA